MHCTRRTRHIGLGFGLLLLASGHVSFSRARGSELEITFPRDHPFVACSAAEMARLQAAWRGSGAEHDIVARCVRQADGFLDEQVIFPPRGGQHNQWYQCEQCEIALKTIDQTHHQCPRCQRIYTGEPYDDVLFSHRHNRNLNQMAAAAWAYAVTGQKAYAAYAGRVLLGYAQRYSQYPYHSNTRTTLVGRYSRSGGHLFEQTLNEAYSMARQIAPAYDLIHDSGVLTPADHQVIREGLIRPILQNIDKYKAGKSNWQSWHNAGLLAGGALLGEADWVRRAIDDPQNGFRRQMEISVTADGMWYENSWGYHFYTLRALVDAAEVARRLEIDLWQDERFGRMFTLPVHYTMADGRLARFGDDVNSSLAGIRPELEAAYQTRRDPAVGALLDDRPGWESILYGRPPGQAGEPPKLESRLFADAGHAILRTQGAAGLTAAFTFGPYGGFHGHFDKLSFVLYGHGRELAVDPGRARSQAYRLPIHQKWYKATLGHNAVCVDGQSQKPAAGILELFGANKNCAAAGARCDQAYEGVWQRRLCCLMDRYLLVLDEIQADRPRRFGWIYHNRSPRLAGSLDGECPFAKDSYIGSEYLNVQAHGPIDGVIRVRFEDDEITTYLTLAGQAGTEVTLADGPFGSVEDRVPLIIAERTGSRVRFAAILEPVAAGEQAHYQDLEVHADDRAIQVLVKGPDQTDIINYGRDSTLTVTRGQETLLAAEPTATENRP
ncbi:MAG: alginate lyase family protein [Sedimentisphaerales bacterium]|nr:alginate lyase family protein [Sedimentisphaerales bacterium]